MLLCQVSRAIITSDLVPSSRWAHAPFLPTNDWQLTLMIFKGLPWVQDGFGLVGEKVCLGSAAESSDERLDRLCDRLGVCEG